MNLLADSLFPSTPFLPFLASLNSACEKTRVPPYAPVLLLTAAVMLGAGVGLFIKSRMERQSGFAAPVVLLAGAVLLLLNGIVCLAGPWRYKAPKLATNDHMEVIVNRLNSLLAAGQALPSDLRALNLPTCTEYGDKTAPGDPLTDGWKRPIVLQPGKEPDECYRLISAGADGKFDTADDYVMAVTRQELEQYKAWKLQQKKYGLDTTTPGSL